jgi:hypothetical protein
MSGLASNPANMQTGKSPHPILGVGAQRYFFSIDFFHFFSFFWKKHGKT